MSSDIVDQKLSKIFINLAKGERKAEISRQVLCDNVDFDPYQLFKLLDKENKQFITNTNILNYLISKGISATNAEVDLLILFYDKNYDKALLFEEFQNLILSQKYVNRYQNGNGNQNINNANNKPISFNVAYSFAKLLEKEIQLARNILILLSEIQNSKNFNIHKIYHEVKVTNYLEQNGIKNFLNKNNEYFLDSDIISILKRLDLNKDGKVDLCEFHLFMGFPKCVICCPCVACCHCGTCYCNKCFCEHVCKYHKRKHRSYNSPIRNNRNINININNNRENQGREYENNSNSRYRYQNRYNNEENLENDIHNNYSYNNINDNNINNNYSYNNINDNNDNNINNNYSYNNINDNNDRNINNNDNNSYKGFSLKTKQILDNNYIPETDMEYRKPYFNREIDQRNPKNSYEYNNSNNYENNNNDYINNNINNINNNINSSADNNDNNYINNNINDNENENDLNMKKISKSLTIRPSPEKKYPRKNNDLPYTRNRHNININNDEYNLLNQNNNNNINIKTYNYKNQSQIEQSPNNNNFDYNSNLQELNQCEENQTTDFNNNNNNQTSKPYNQNEYEENQFNEFIRQIMVAEGQLEKLKVSLALCPDFNCEDCFRIFEVDNQGILSPEDIKSGLNLIGVFYSDFEVKLFFKRFDLQKRGHITYGDFFDIFVPFQKEYRTLVEERKPNSCCPCRCPDIFCPETISLLKNLMDAIIRYENNFNFLRRGFTTLNLKLKSIFENIDVMKIGYFTNSDLSVYLKKNKIYSNDLDKDLLFIRLDKNRNGKIDYNEIYDETHPLYNLI